MPTPNILRPVLGLQARELPYPFDGIYRVTCTLDTVLTRNRPCERQKQYIRALMDSGAREITPRTRKAGDGRLWWFPVQATEPTQRTFAVIDRWKPKQWGEWPGAHIGRHDVAINLHIAEEAPRQRLLEHLGERIHLQRISGRATRYWVGSTLYLHDTRGADQPHRTLVMYPKEGTDILRIEFRFQSADAVKRNDLDNVSAEGLQAINPQAIAARHLALREVDPAFIEQKVKRALREQRMVYGHTPQWAKRVPEWVEDHWRHYAMMSPKHELPTVRGDVGLLLSIIPTWVDVPE